MDFDADAPGPYIGRAPGARRPQPALVAQSGRQSGARTSTRAVDRMLLALRAYEQRAQRRAALRLWVLARRGSVDATRA